jgi:WD40 repeat protein
LGEPIRPEVGLVTAIAFSPDGALVVAGEAGRAVLVDPASGADAGEPLRLPEGRPTSAEFSRDGHVLAVSNSDGRTQLFDVASRHELGPPLVAASSGITDVSFSPDGTALATAGLDRTGALWRLDASRAIGTVAADHRAAVTEVAYTPDGRYRVSASVDGTLVIRDLSSGASRSIEIGGEVLTVAVDASGQHVAVGGTTGQVQVFDVRTGRAGRSLQLGDLWVHQVAFNPTTGAIAAAADASHGKGGDFGERGFVVVWDPRTGRELGSRIESLGGLPFGVAWRPDGSQLAVTLDNNLVRFYAAGVAHKEVGEPIENVDAPIAAVAFSPDGARLATGASSGVVRQWSASTHRPLGPQLEGHAGIVAGVTYSPDGSTLASTTLGFSATRLWDARTGASIGGELIGGRIPLTFSTFQLDHFHGSRPAFSPDGSVLATPSFDGTTSVWQLSPARWLAAACAVVGRDLTKAEWTQHLGDRAYRRTCGGVLR